MASNNYHSDKGEALSLKYSSPKSRNSDKFNQQFLFPSSSVDAPPPRCRVLTLRRLVIHC